MRRLAIRQLPAVAAGRRRDPRRRCTCPGTPALRLAIHAGHRAIAAFFARVEEIPDAILLDRTADAAREIPQLQEIARRAQPAVLQVLRVVAADHAAGHAREVGVPLDGVAAGPRDDVHHRSADFGFAESAGRGERHFLRAPEIRHVARRAAAASGAPGIQSVELHAPFGAASARAAEHREPRHDLNIERGAGAHRHGGIEAEDGAVGARRRNGRDDVAADRRLPLRALDVDDRRFAG